MSLDDHSLCAYNLGQPADNAAHFVEYIKNVKADELAGVKFAVFGCGNREWVSTYQAIPRLVDSLLTKAGAQQLLDRAEADAGGDSFFEIFDTWEEKLWPTLAQAFDVQSGAPTAKEEDFVVHVTDTVRAAKLRQGDTGLGKVIENRVLTKEGAPVKRHIGTTFGFTARFSFDPIAMQNLSCHRARLIGLATISLCAYVRFHCGRY